MAKKDELREVPKKNYFIVLVVSILVVVLTLYVRSFYFNYVQNNIEGSIFYDKSINQVNIDDIDYAFSELNNGIIFVSFNGNKTISNMERRLYREVKKQELNDKFIYLNVTSSLNNDRYIKKLRNRFPENESNINKGPMFIYVKDGASVEVIDSSEKLVDYKVLNTLLLTYGIE